MTWKIRHAGSPRSVDGLSPAEVVEGLQDGLWEPTDEVMGPEDSTWVAIENHPTFAEIAADLEPPPARVHDDETRLDMNPLIDVCLVLLIFFILTTSYAALQKVLDMPGVASKNPTKGVPKKKDDEVKKITIRVVATMERGEPVIHVEEEKVPLKDLAGVLASYHRKTGKTELLFDVSPDVDWGTVIAVQDAAKKAEIQKVNFLKK
jgi:biopolymer transport protein ExbD